MAQQLRIQGRFGFNVQLVKSEKNQLGAGSYGAVYKARCDLLLCAAKVLHPILFTGNPATDRNLERFQQEIEFLKDLRHPNIIQYLGSCADPETGLPVLFMELMDESLTRFLERPANPSPIPLNVQVDIAHDIAQAISHLHRHEVLHRDLSSNNILLIGSQRAKVSDFGMAKVFEDNPQLSLTTCPGTSCYMAPEALAKPPIYTSKLDVFSCGVLFVQLITGKFPNPGPNTCKQEIDDPRFPMGQVHVDIPELERRREHLEIIAPTHPLRVIAVGCLQDKESMRPTADELCSCLISLKESIAGENSCNEQQPPPKDQEEEPKKRIEQLTKEVQQMQMPKDENAESAQGGKKLNLTGAVKALQKLWRSLELIIYNKTKGTTLKFDEDYFFTGIWFEPLSSSTIPPCSISVAYVASKPGAFTGVTGGCTFKMQSKGEKVKYVIIGFTNPVVGSYKTYISISDENPGAKNGYENATDINYQHLTYGDYAAEATITVPREWGNKQMLFTISDYESN